MSDDRQKRSLDSAKKEAKRWLDELRANDAVAYTRFKRVMRDAPETPTLRDVQHALALEHGHSGWAALTASIEQTHAARQDAGSHALTLYNEMASALLEAYRSGTPEAMTRHYRHTWHRRPWSAMRTYVQLDLGKRPAHAADTVDITLDDARHLVAREHGFMDWAALEAFARTSAMPVRMAAKPVRLVRRAGASASRAVAASRDWGEILDLLTTNQTLALDAQGQMTDAVLADLSRIEGITALDLAGSTSVTDDGLRHLARLPTLQHLDLSGTNVTDAGLTVLSSLPRLRTLSLAWTRLTDAGAAVLAHCEDLERVDLAGTKAGDAALRALGGKRQLRHLSIALTDAGIPLLHELPMFKSWHEGEIALALLGAKRVPTHLSLRGAITDHGMAHLRGLDGLFSLDIDDTCLGFTAAGLAPLVSLAHLGALGLDAKDDWMPHIAAMPHLRFLSAQDTVAGDDGFEALSRSSSIEYIWGRRCHNLRARGFRSLASMPALRGLSVSCLNVDDGAVSALPDFPALRELMPMDVPDTGYRHIGRCARLEALILMYCRDTTDVATTHVTGLSHLRRYFNSYTTITDRTPALLSTMDSLEQVTFDACHGLTDAGVARLARLPRLRELRVSGRGITPAVTSAFPVGVVVSDG